MPFENSWKSEEHHLFAETIERFFAEEIVPNEEVWEKAGQVDDAVWASAGVLSE